MVDVSKVKKKMQIINRESVLNNFVILNLQKSLVKILKNLVRGNKKEIKRKQILQHYLNGIRIKIWEGKIIKLFFSISVKIKYVVSLGKYY